MENVPQPNTSLSSTLPRSSKNKTIAFIVLGLVVISSSIIVGMKLESTQKSTLVEQAVAPKPTAIISTPESTPSTFKESIPSLSIVHPSGWIIKETSDGYSFKNRLPKYCDEYADGYYETEKPCKESPSQKESFADIDGVVWGSIRLLSYCNDILDSSLYGDKLKLYDCNEFNGEKMIRYKDMLMPSFKWPETPPCQPTDISNKQTPVVMNIAGNTALRQKSKSICLYENPTSSLLSTNHYLIYVEGNSKYNIIDIDIRYSDSSPEAIEAVKTFEKMLNTIEIKN